MSTPEILGFRDQPERTASNSVYTGRLCCDDVQITGDGADAIATFTVTARQLVDAAKTEMLWTDQDVQRGVRPEITNRVEKELSLSRGYPPTDIYVFNAESADDMTEKLLRGQRLFINPLVWNLRPSSFDAYFDATERKIYIYDGKIYLPDSHHRHQAILKAAAIYKSAPNEYPHFDLNKQFKVELYFLKKTDEGNYFFDKNQRPTPTAKSKAYDLTSLDDLSVLAKRVIDLTPSLTGNVNRVTDRLTAQNPNVVTLSTLRETLKHASESEGLDESEIEGFATVASKLFQLLTEVRPELGNLHLAERKRIRSLSLVDAPIMFQGYSALISDFNIDVVKLGLSKATETWRRRLSKLSSAVSYSEDGWTGDFFEKSNPLWTRLGIVKPGVSGRPTVSNNRAARIQAMRALRGVIANSTGTTDIRQFLP
ncbi:DNA sulfur modification protein DndB [Roseateles sp. DXS20W]|uniref:DNA sulfur modification protein DndB n=1 Tax=Pelomonas lactea TaxID=3299030 RepID=A0ABW7GFV0_9BURK